MKTFAASLILVALTAACAHQPAMDGPVIFATENEAYASKHCALTNPGDERLVLPYGDGFTCEIQNGN